MKKVLKKFTLITSILLCFSLFLQTTNAKYITSISGVLFDLVFSNYEFIENIYVVENPDGGYSDSLWGAGDESSSPGEDDYLDSLEDKAFYVKNKSGKRMMFYLYITFYLHWANANSTFDAQVLKVGDSETYYCTLSSSTSNELGYITYTKEDSSGSSGFLDSGYKCTASIEPSKLVSKDSNGNKTQITSQQIENSFVINDGESAAFHFSIFYEASGINWNLYSKYVTVQLVSVPYE